MNVKQFWARVDKSFAENGEQGCWIWMGARFKEGYGMIRVPPTGKKGTYSLAHRVAWELTNGPIPDGLNVLHNCDNPPCVNPFHLFLGTDTDNQNDALDKGRKLSGEKHRWAKLKLAQVNQIKSSNLSQRKLATQFGVSRWTIRAIKDGKAWKRS
jgi:hypothetical protein